MKQFSEEVTNIVKEKLQAEFGTGYMTQINVVKHDDGDYTIEAWDTYGEDGEVDEDISESVGEFISDELFGPIVDYVIDNAPELDEVDIEFVF